MTPEAGLLIAERYQLLGELAAGGMGSVWRARHVQLDVDVAIKFMATRLANNKMGRARFEREAKAAAKLRSPHVTQILDYGLQDNTPYIAMELLEGEDLRTLLKRSGTLSLKRCLILTEQLTRGLMLAHEAGIVHRDLKPSNVFIQTLGNERIVKVLDFGVAKDTKLQLAEGEGTQSGALVGSPRYMSPEQAIGASIDARSDLWSLGVMIYEMLTGVPTFNSNHLGQLFTRICQADYRPASEVNERLPAPIDAFFRRALEPDPNNRFETAEQLLQGLRTIASMNPLLDTLEGAATSPATAAPSAREAATAELQSDSHVRPTAEAKHGQDDKRSQDAEASASQPIPSEDASQDDENDDREAAPTPQPTVPAAPNDTGALTSLMDSQERRAAAKAAHDTVSEMGAQQLPARTAGSARLLWMGIGALLLGGSGALLSQSSQNNNPESSAASAESIAHDASDAAATNNLAGSATAADSDGAVLAFSGTPTTSASSLPAASANPTASASASASASVSTHRRPPLRRFRPKPPTPKRPPVVAPTAGPDPDFGVDPTQ